VGKTGIFDGHNSQQKNDALIVRSSKDAIVALALTVVAWRNRWTNLVSEDGTESCLANTPGERELAQDACCSDGPIIQRVTNRPACMHVV
jgi:hypothetical protein